MTPSVRIVEADLQRTEHQHAVLQLLNAQAAESMGQDAAFTKETDARIISRLRDEARILTLLAFMGSTPVGIAIGFQGFSVEPDTPHLRLSDFFVLAPWRGRGIGRALLAAAEDLARALPCSQLLLHVSTGNAPARRLYEAHGFLLTPAADLPEGVLCLVKNL